MTCPSGKKSWNYRYRFNGKSNRYSIAYSILPNRARRKAKAIADELAKNVDPSQAKCRLAGR
jgi:hypothetical protein